MPCTSLRRMPQRPRLSPQSVRSSTNWQPRFLTCAVKTLGIAIPPSSFPTLSYYTTILTLLFLAPSIVTGGSELMPVIQRDGFSSKKAKIGITHAIIMDVAFAATAYNWWTRRSNPGFMPDATNILISAVMAMPLTLYSASLGGALVYKHGMGFQTKSAKKKQ
jgi:uncharacterized membrane protein